MSRNDDFINIDQVFKNLANAEESEPIGAWDKMESLLDKNMPIKETNSYKRYGFPILIASVLIITAGLILGNTTGIGNYFQSGSSTNESIAQNKNEQNNNTTKQTKEAQLKPNQNAVSLANLDKEIKIESAKKVESKKVIIASSNNNETVYRKESKFKNNNAQIPDLNSKKLKQQKTFKGNATQNAVDLPSWNNNQNKVAAIIPEDLLVTKPIIEQKIVEVIKGDQKKIEENLNLQGNLTEEKWTPETSFKEKTVVRNEHGQLFEKEEKQFERIDLTKKQIVAKPNPSKIRTVIDTISIAKVQQIKYTPLSIMEAYEINQLLYAAAKPIKENASEVAFANSSKTTINSNFLVPLSNYKVKSRKINTIDFIKNTAGGIHNYFDGTHKFNAGFLLGGNVSAGAQNAYGMQAGFVGNYNFAERWTVSAEFKFINKYFPSFTYQDEAESYDVSKTEQNNGWLFTGMGTTLTNTYTLKNINILSFPLYLGYSVTDRLVVNAGVNFNYNMPLQFTTNMRVSNFPVNALSSSGDNPFENSSFKLNEAQDFNKRFGIGYLIGFNYELSRRFSLDCRMTQSLWNNGSNNISDINNIYTNPSFEVALGIYFGRREKVIYIMDRK